jgi:hypothetical protein
MDLFGKQLNPLLGLLRVDWFVAQLTPVVVLASHDEFCKGVAGPDRRAFHLIAADPVDRQDPIPSAETLLASGEVLELVAAGWALEVVRRQDRDEEGHFVQRAFDAFLPCLTPRDALAVLEDVEPAAGERPYRVAQPHLKRGQLAMLVLVIEVCVAHERGWPGRLDHRSPLPAVSVARPLIPYWAYLDLAPLAMSMRLRHARAIRRQRPLHPGRVRDDDATAMAPDHVAPAGNR